MTQVARNLDDVRAVCVAVAQLLDDKRVSDDLVAIVIGILREMPWVTPAQIATVVREGREEARRLMGGTP